MARFGGTRFGGTHQFSFWRHGDTHQFHRFKTTSSTSPSENEPLRRVSVSHILPRCTKSIKAAKEYTRPDATKPRSKRGKLSKGIAMPPTPYRRWTIQENDQARKGWAKQWVERHFPSYSPKPWESRQRYNVSNAPCPQDDEMNDVTELVKQSVSLESEIIVTTRRNEARSRWKLETPWDRDLRNVRKLRREQAVLLQQAKMNRENGENEQRRR